MTRVWVGRLQQCRCGCWALLAGKLVIFRFDQSQVASVPALDINFGGHLTAAALVMIMMVGEGKEFDIHILDRMIRTVFL